MPDIFLITVLFAVGAAMLVAEIFLPSHGVLSVVGLGFLIAAIVKTHQFAGPNAAIVAVLICLVLLPTASYLSIKHWRQTRVGKAIAPMNPTLTVEDTSIPVREITAMIGTTGKTISPLRPVGVCEFGGRRVSCTAKFGMLDAGVEVEGVGMSGGNLEVVEKKA